MTSCTDFASYQRYSQIPVRTTAKRWRLSSFRGTVCHGFYDWNTCLWSFFCPCVRWVENAVGTVRFWAAVALKLMQCWVPQRGSPLLPSRCTSGSSFSGSAPPQRRQGMQLRVQSEFLLELASCAWLLGAHHHSGSRFWCLGWRCIPSLSLPPQFRAWHCVEKSHRRRRCALVPVLTADLAR